MTTFWSWYWVTLQWAVVFDLTCLAFGLPVIAYLRNRRARGC